MAIEVERNQEAVTWATDTLTQSGAIRECDKHGYLVDRGDLEALERAVGDARAKPPGGMSPDAAEDLVRRVAQSMPAVCPGCP